MVFSDQQLDTYADEIYAEAQKPKRDGGCGPLVRRMLDKDRIKRVITCAENRVSGFSAFEVRNASKETIDAIVEDAKSIEPRSAIIAMLGMWLLELFLEWVAKKWLAMRPATA